MDFLRSAASPWAQYLILAGTVATLIGIPLLYAHLAPRLGVLGLVGTGLCLVGNATCAMAHLIVEAMVLLPSPLVLTFRRLTTSAGVRRREVRRARPT